MAAYFSALPVRDTEISRHRSVWWQKLKVGSRRAGAWRPS